MSSGWLRDPVFAAPVPFGWKLCFRIVPKAICLTVSVLLVALRLGDLALALALELELELVHPAVAARPAATTVTLSQVFLRRL